MNCAVLHRALGQRVSLVRSLSMDPWLEPQLKQMALGGNKALKAFYAKYDLIEEEVQMKYNSVAAEYYRVKLRSLAEGIQFSEDEPSFQDGRNVVVLNEEE